MLKLFPVVYQMVRNFPYMSSHTLKLLTGKCGGEKKGKQQQKKTCIRNFPETKKEQKKKQRKRKKIQFL